MPAEKEIKWLFAVNAFINWTVSLRGIIDPAGLIDMLGGEPTNYTFIVRLWCAFIFMFGCMFWEVSRNVRGKAALIKYNWIEKTLTASAVTLGYVSGEAPTALMVMIVLTNWLWIPFLLWADIRLHRQMRREG